MKDWISINLKKVFVFITLTILSGIILDAARYIYSVSVSVIGQAGNFFVNLYFACAAQISLSTLISFLASANISSLLSAYWFVSLRNLKKIKEIESSVQENNRSDKGISPSPKKAKVLSIISLCLTAFLFADFMFILSAFQLKNNFDRRIAVLNAIIPQEQIYKLNARWYLMRTKKSYLKLMDDIKSVEENHKVELEKLSASQGD